MQRHAMLYERWKEIVRQHRNEPALRDVASGRRWTFGELAAEAEQRPEIPADSEKSRASNARVVFPNGNSVKFVLDTLAGWREGAITCPLETGSTIDALPDVPTSCVHLKWTSGTTGAARAIAF